MRRSAISTALSAVALLFLAACGPPRADTADEKAVAAWKLYLSHPDKGTYENFLRANRFAAHQHDMEHDATGVEYQLRALEIQAAEAERTKDASLADDVVSYVDDIERRELTANYDEAVPGAKARLAAAKERAGRVIR